MMRVILRKPTIMRMNDKYISYLNKYNIDSVYSIENRMDRAKVITDLRNRRLYVIIDGHEVYIKHLTLPYVNKEETERLIYNELKNYINDISNVIFSFDVYNTHEKFQEVLVYCLNWANLDFLKHYVNNNNKIAGVFMIQFCYLKYYKDSIKSDKFMLVFHYNESMYLLVCSNGNMISNKVFKLKGDTSDDNNMVRSMNELYNEYFASDKIDIYFANIEATKNIKLNSTRYNILQLHQVSNDKIINCCIH